MPEIRHVAIAVRDAFDTAEFYKSAFDMIEVERGTTPRSNYVYVTDGQVCLAVLQYKSDEMAGIEDAGHFVGAHHIGIQVPNLAQFQKRAETVGGKFHFNLGNESKPNFESKYRDPNGVMIDLSYTGWVGTPTQRVKGNSPDVEPNRIAPHIRNATVMVPDPKKSADFMVEAFGFKRLDDVRVNDGIYVSDGYVSILFSKTTLAEKADNPRWNHIGIREFSYLVDDVHAADAKIRAAGGRLIGERRIRSDAPATEQVYRDREGVVFGVSSAGWPTAQ
jgi:catechol 2,3-dioxygenase-like lactoylglutathione lyase family enzyme